MNGYHRHVPMTCLNKQNKILLFLVTNGDLTLFFFHTNSMRADKLSPIVSRILNEKKAYISGRLLSYHYFFCKKNTTYSTGLGYVLNGSMDERVSE